MNAGRKDRVGATLSVHEKLMDTATNSVLNSRIRAMDSQEHGRPLRKVEEGGEGVSF